MPDFGNAGTTCWEGKQERHQPTALRADMCNTMPGRLREWSRGSTSLGQTPEIESHCQVGMEAVHIRGSQSLGLCGATVAVRRNGDDVLANRAEVGKENARSLNDPRLEVEGLIRHIA
jgi:hypothetical protein